jgi:hypothetical protein
LAFLKSKACPEWSQVPTEVISEHFRVSVRMSLQDGLQFSSELWMPQCGAEGAVEDLTARFCEAAAFGDFVPEFEVVAFEFARG